MEPETFWRRMLARWRALAIVTAVGVTLFSVAPFVFSVLEPGEASGYSQVVRMVDEPSKSRNDWDQWTKEFDERMDQRMAALDQAAEEAENREPPKRRVRKVRKFRWESPADTRGQLWNIPEEESDLAVLEAFLRICIAEADGHLQDCIGIWQVFKTIRRRECSRGHVRRITECDDNGETMLSVMRRSQRHIMGMIPLRNKRAAWISKMTIDCENPPEGYPGATEVERIDDWNFRYFDRCTRVVQLGRYLMEGELPPPRPGVKLEWLPGRPVTWGGRCESKKASCDDRMACSRGLARIKGPDTHNAFWCRPGRPGCPADDIDPICIKMGYQSLKQPESTLTKAEPTKAIDPQT